MRHGNILIPVLAIVFAVLSAVTVVYFGFVQDLTNENVNNANTVVAGGNANAVTNTNTVVVNANANANANTNVVVNTNTATVTADSSCTYTAPNNWKTYTNAAIGYRLNYPADWTVKEINNLPDEMFNQPVKYITITKGNYFLAVGVRHNNDTFLTSDRTGVGAGDFVSAGTEKICDTNISASKLVSSNKAKEWFYSPNGPGLVTVLGHKVNAALSFSGAGNVYEVLDMTNSTELGITRNIMKTLTFID